MIKKIIEKLPLNKFSIEKLKSEVFKSDKAKSSEDKKSHFKDVVDDANRKIREYDWRRLQRLTHPKAADDLNAFLEKLPQNAGNTILIIAGVVWSAAAVLGLFTAVQLQKMETVKMELEEADALKPIVPVVKISSVSPNDVKKMSETLTEIYGGLRFEASGSTITITSDGLSGYGQFREALAYIQNGGKNWQVSIRKLCVGRECKTKALEAVLSVNKVSVQGS
mgnify:CR=1 FL=1